MSSRSSQPALYEKIRIREGLLGPSPKVDVPLLSSPSEADEDEWSGQGRTLRLPLGIVFIGGAMIIALFAFVFMIGHRQGYGVARAEFEDGILTGKSTGRGGDALRTLDPPGEPSGKSPSVLYQAPALAPTKVTEPPKAQSRPRSQWGPVNSKPDPRKKGQTYFILAETNETGAVKLAEFCRNSGLETYVVPSKNDRLRRVVAFPGFEAGSRSKPEVKALEAFIHSIGEKWAKAERGGSNLHDAYPSPY
ncbi:MAG: hypothetical protein L0Y44_12355 [Phycisphaerales bacterium]|nr:hypothetical protein [Phycisphaerales bacterium]MCI0631433.1 hypothetical protein [Phycisphaerales bacterium]MCI0676588.1 hypothetical protein [Phycisphaerales bacterium]